CGIIDLVQKPQIPFAIDSAGFYFHVFASKFLDFFCQNRFQAEESFYLYIEIIGVHPANLINFAQWHGSKLGSIPLIIIFSTRTGILRKLSISSLFWWKILL